MNEEHMSLTYTDRLILESYKNMLEGLSDYLGDGYEFVLHSLENYDHSVIKIINGFHTGRTEGAPITDLALSMLERINGKDGAGSISYYTKNKKGEPLKSATITISGERGRTIGLLCINFYLNTPFTDVVSTFCEQKAPLSTSQSGENFAENIDDLIESAVAEVRQEVYENYAVPANCKNKEILRILASRGIFKLKDSVAKTAKLLNICRNTVYMHIRNLKSASEQ